MADYTEADVKRILEEIRQEYEEARRREEAGESLEAGESHEAGEDYEEYEDCEDFGYDGIWDEDCGECDEDDEPVLVDVESREARRIAAKGTLDELIAWARGGR